MTDYPRSFKRPPQIDQAHLHHHGAPLVTAVLGLVDRWIRWRGPSWHAADSRRTNPAINLHEGRRSIPRFTQTYLILLGSSKSGSNPRGST